eukprot:1196390-Prorocentrum_minimum.AAC.11
MPKGVQGSRTVTRSRTAQQLIDRSLRLTSLRRQYQRRLRSTVYCAVRERVTVRLPCTPFGMEQLVHGIPRLTHSATRRCGVPELTPEPATGLSYPNP